jgi:hypothetical protein
MQALIDYDGWRKWKDWGVADAAQRDRSTERGQKPRKGSEERSSSNNNKARERERESAVAQRGNTLEKLESGGQGREGEGKGGASASKEVKKKRRESLVVSRGGEVLGSVGEANEEEG